MITSEQKEYLIRLEEAGKLKYSIDAVRLRGFVNLHQHHVEISDRGRLTSRGIEVGCNVVVLCNHKFYLEFGGEVGKVVSIDFYDQHPRVVYPEPYAHSTVGWIEKHGQNWNKKPKNDTPCIGVVFPSQPHATWCFREITDLVAVK